MAIKSITNNFTETVVMKFQIDKKKLLQALIDTRCAVMPYSEAYKYQERAIYTCYVFTADCGMVTIQTSNGDISISETVSIAMDTTGEKKSFAVDANDMLRVFRTLDEQTLTIEVLEYQIVVTHSFGSFALPLFQGVEMYNLTMPELSNRDYHHITMESPGLRSILNRLKGSMANDELRPALNGVIVNSTEDYTDFVSSDGHLLSKIRKTTIKTDSPDCIILPRKAVNILAKILPTTGFVDFYYDVIYGDEYHTHYTIIADGLTVWGRPVEGRFPDYARVIPNMFIQSFQINQRSLIKSLYRLGQFSGEADVVKFELSETKGLTAIAQDKDYEMSAKENLPIVYSGEDFLIGFKSTTLRNILKSFTSINVVFNLTTPTGAVVIQPEIQPENEELTMLVMPMIIEER